MTGVCSRCGRQVGDAAHCPYCTQPNGTGPSEHPVEYLWRRLLDIVRSYPEGSVPVPSGYRIEALGCFPCGYGLWNKRPGQPPPPIPARAVMLLAHNWGSIVELDRYRAGESPDSRYWGNLRPLLEGAGICLGNCFATNAYPGLVTADSNIGKFPGMDDAQFQKACQQFLTEQIRVVRPALIVTLGLYVPPFLARLSPNLRGWRAVVKLKLKHLNDDNALMSRAMFKDACHTATVVALTHPSYRQLNARHRRYRGRAGDDAERTMLEDAWKASQEIV